MPGSNVAAWNRFECKPVVNGCLINPESSRGRTVNRDSRDSSCRGMAAIVRKEEILARSRRVASVKLNIYMAGSELESCTVFANGYCRIVRTLRPAEDNLSVA